MANYQKDTGDVQVEELGGRQVNLASYALMAKIMTIVITGFSFIVVARILGPSTYGIYTLVVAVGGAFITIGELGTTNILIKFTAEHLQRKEMSELQTVIINGFLLLLVVSVVLGIIAYFLSSAIAQYALHDTAYSGILTLVPFVIVASLLWGFSTAILIGLSRGRDFGITTLIQTSAQASISITLALLGFGAVAPLVGLASGLGIGFLAQAALIMRRVGMSAKKAGEVSTKFIRKLLSLSLPLYGYNIIGGLTSNISVVMLGLFSTSVVLGNYGVTSKAGSVFDTISGSISIALLPLFAAALADKRLKKHVGKYYNYALYFSFVFLTPVVMYVIALAQPVTYVIFGGAYSLAPTYVAIMSAGILASLIGGFAANLIIMAGQSRKYLKYGVIINATQLILLALLLPGYNGIAMVTIVFFLIPLLSSMLFFKRVEKTFGITLDVKKLLRVVAAGIISALFIIPLYYLLTAYYIPLIIAALIEQIILYPIILSYLGGVVKSDIAALRSVSKHMPVVNRFITLMLDYTSNFAR